MPSNLVIFSIGNPGSLTRHSVGHEILADLAKHFDSEDFVSPKRSKYSISKTHDLTLIKSEEYMNNSGISFRQIIEGERLRLSQKIILILCDDFDLKLGLVRLSMIKKNDSHNGIRSISQQMLRINQDLHVVKLGIGIGPKPQGNRDRIVSWTLSKFKPEELEIIKTISLEKIISLINYAIQMDGSFNVTELNKVLKS